MPDESRKFDVIAIANKKRHAYLLEKLSKASLTAGELEELKRFENADLPAGVVETMAQVGKTFGVTERTVQNWAKAGMPRRSDSRYDLAEIYAWRTEKEGGEDATGEKTKWDTHYRQYKALIVEIEYRKMLGDLITKEEVEHGRVQRITVVKKALLSLPARLAPQVVNLDVKKAEEVIRIRVEEIINDFAKGNDGSINTASTDQETKSMV